MTRSRARGGVRAWGWAARGAGRVAAAQARAGAWASDLPGLVAAQGRGRRRCDLAVVTPRERLTWADLADRVASHPDQRAARMATGRLAVREDDPVDLIVRVLAGMRRGVHVRVVPRRAGEEVWREAQRWAADHRRRRTTALRTPPGRVSFLTSGTSGAPAPVEQRLSALLAVQYLSLVGALPLGRRRRIACLAPLDHGHGFGAFAATLAVGGTFVVLPELSDEALALLDPAPDLVTGVPVQLADLLARTLGPVASTILSGSDRLPPDLAAAWRARGSRVLDAYGTTETGTIALGDGWLRPLAGVTVRQRGDALAVTSATCRTPREFDRGHIKRGRIVITGRADGAVVTGGEVSDPERLRAWLVKQPGITAASVFTVPDPRFTTRYACRVRGAVPDEPLWRERIKRDLGPALVPRWIESD